MSSPEIAVVGMACRFPDAASPAALWEVVLARRQGFRAMPAERLPMAEYASASAGSPDLVYPIRVAALEGYEFDRGRFRVPGPSYRAADLAHWLALEVAADALADFGGALPDHLREASAVYVGNSLTGDASRANALRQRWPYVERVVRSALETAGVPANTLGDLLDRAEGEFKRPFPAPNEESLAGSLSNTIAGRVCGAFGLRGGGYVVDGACASSLLAVAHACSALQCGDIDLALAGGVDLSLDPMELVGFARAGALAPDDMRVYDTRASGFWPGEGCGFVVLVRSADAAAAGRQVYAVVRGWGVSSDGAGSLTRPERAGQFLAIQRAYRRAGYAAGTVGYFEGHGTGTPVGDKVELAALGEASRGAAVPPAVGSVKANIGHTKAAAGVAGFIKAVMAVHTRTLPPHTGCSSPLPEVTGPGAPLRVLAIGEPWPTGRPLRAGVSAAGFGGINVHVTLEAPAAQPAPGALDARLFCPTQDHELFCIAGDSAERVLSAVRRLQAVVPRVSRAEFTDLAAHLATAPPGPVRAAVVARRPEELAAQLALLETWLVNAPATRLDPEAGIFLGTSGRVGRVGFLFPGQGASPPKHGGAIGNRFGEAGGLDGGELDPGTAAGTQVALVRAALTGMRALARLGIEASCAVGHSLGELAALHWAGAVPGDELLRLARARGTAFDRSGGPPVAMAAVSARWPEVEAALGPEGACVACHNSPTQTTVSGSAAAVAAVAETARARGWDARPLRVTHAFHSPFARPAAALFREALAQARFDRLARPVGSTVTGTWLPGSADLRALLAAQITRPVLFEEAVRAAGDGVDFWVEVGAGTALARLATEVSGTPAVSLEVGHDSLRGLLLAAAGAYAVRAFTAPAVLFADRFVRPFDPGRPFSFITNPCEAHPPERGTGTAPPRTSGPTTRRETIPAVTGAPAARDVAPTTARPELKQILELTRALVAAKVELPLDQIRETTRLSRDLHLNSITVGQLVVEACRALGLALPVAPTEFADATVGEVARSLDQRLTVGDPKRSTGSAVTPAGVSNWVRPFVLGFIEQPGAARTESDRRSDWLTFPAPAGPFAAAVREALTGRAPAGGVLVCAHTCRGELPAGVLLSAIRALDNPGTEQRFVLVHDGGPAAAVARTLHLERPGVAVVVVTVPFNVPGAAGWVAGEVTGAVGFSEAHFDERGVRSEPVLRTLPAEPAPHLPLTPGDVLLVTGGGKGIAAECALALAKRCGVRVGLMGRSEATDSILCENLARFRLAGVPVQYARADVTDAPAVRDAVARLADHLGPVRGLVHAAGVNQPKLLTELDEACFAATAAPKALGLRNVLAALRPADLKLLVTFGSVIARSGLPGEADYGLANEFLAWEVDRLRQALPGCRCLNLEWSVWSGVGMGERLGRVDVLHASGVSPISPDEGVRAFCDLVGRAPPTSSVVVTGRLGGLPTLRPEPPPPLPFLRFLDKPRVHWDRIELVADAELSSATDPYLTDHAVDGELVFPAVLGLEAMAQAVSGLTGGRRVRLFENVRFDRPVVVPARGASVVRVAALEAGDRERVDVVVRSDATDFVVNHFAATCRTGAGESIDAPRGRSAPADEDLLAGWDPRPDLYGKLLFHTGRFRRICGYRRLSARECVAEVVAEDARWFGPLLPPELLLGDPGTRDAALHAVQACIPHRRVLPVGVDRLLIRKFTSGSHSVHAVERRRGADEFTFDLTLFDREGQVAETWDGVRFRAVGERRVVAGLHPALTAAYLERSLAERWGWGGRLLAGTGAPSETSAVVKRALADGADVGRRPDGKPCLAGDTGDDVSVSRCGSTVFGACAPGRVACDVEAIRPREEAAWRGLLGADRWTLVERIRAETDETTEGAATRVWAAVECLKKLGLGPTAALAARPEPVTRWVTFAAGGAVIATYDDSPADDRPGLIWAVADTLGGRTA